MFNSPRVALVVRAGLLLLALPASAQWKYGDFTSSANGTLSFGYSADYGNLTGSDHSWVLGGTGNFTGSFYNPNFLTYAASVFLNQSRANSNFQSISDASGFAVSTNIFGGSRFPGAVSYSKTYNSDGNYGIPGLPSYVTHGNNDAFAVSWNANLPKAPTLSAGFQMGTNDYSVYGTNDEGNSAYHTLNLRSTYQVEGFNMIGFYNLGGSHSQIPEVVSGTTNLNVDSDTDGYGFGVSHKLPLQGSISANINRSTWDTDYQGTSTNGTVDTVNMFAAIHPLEKVNVSGSAQYSDNLTGQLIQAIISAGGGIPALETNQSSDSLDLQATGTYVPNRNVQTSLFVERRSQLFEDVNYIVDSYGGSANYTHRLYQGNFNAGVVFVANHADENGSDSLGFSANSNYSNEFKGWHVNGSFAYAQNMQTLLVTYLNSSYSFSGDVRRRFGNFTFSAGAGGSRTALTDQPGTESSSQSYNASVGYGSWINANGYYSKSSGQALATGGGLVPIPIPPPLLPSELVTLYGGTSYAGAVSSAPMRGLSLSASYARSDSTTSSTGITSANQNDQFNALVQYRVRKTGFISGYARLQQGFSGSGAQPEIISSYYVGLTRWFSFF